MLYITIWIKASAKWRNINIFCGIHIISNVFLYREGIKGLLKPSNYAFCSTKNTQTLTVLDNCTVGSKWGYTELKMCAPECSTNSYTSRWRYVTYSLKINLSQKDAIRIVFNFLNCSWHEMLYWCITYVMLQFFILKLF